MGAGSSSCVALARGGRDGGVSEDARDHASRDGQPEYLALIGAVQQIEVSIL
jgi:hypothetical protein